MGGGTERSAMTRAVVLGIGLGCLGLGILLWWSVGLAASDESSCEHRLGTVQEQLTDAKAVVTQFYLPNMGLQVVSINKE